MKQKREMNSRDNSGLKIRRFGDFLNSDESNSSHSKLFGPFLGSDCETNNATTFPDVQQFLISNNRLPMLGNGSVNTLPRQQLRNNKGTVGSCVFYGGPCRGVIKRTTGVYEYGDLALHVGGVSNLRQ
jgi:hypothetical protein